MPGRYVVTADWMEMAPGDGTGQKRRTTWVFDGDTTLTDIDAHIDLDGEYPYRTKPIVTITRDRKGSDNADQ